MENSGEAEDDQGSRWLQVKKKHRSSSKFSLQGWVGGSSGKQTSSIPNSHVASTGKSGNLLGKFGNNPSRERKDLSVQRQGGIINNVNSVSNEEKDVHYLDKSVVCQDDGCTESPVLTAAKKCDNKAGVVEEIPEKDNKPNPCQTIKRGDLDDGELAQHIKNTLATEIRFGDIGNGDVISGKVDDANIVVSCISSTIDVKGDKVVVTTVDREHSLCRSSSFAFGSEDNCKDVNEVVSEDVKIQITSEEVANSGGNVLNGGKAGLERKKAVNNDPTDAASLIDSAAVEEDGMIREVPTFTIMQGVGNSEISDVPVTAGASSTMANHPYDHSLATQVSGPKKSRDFMETASSFEGSDHQQTDKICGDLSNTQIQSGNDASDMGESKERFRQRLWCFLFENLNRAVDELYLLCELECDMEQMKEAMLVLEEAASDFKELKSRVEAFENVKRSTTSQFIEVPPMTLKPDHRRPHALSWEVRRMTTSPHKAEILSSSLEAFRKIQQERAKVHAACDAEKLEIGCPSFHQIISDDPEKYSGDSYTTANAKETVMKVRKQSEVSDIPRQNFIGEKRNADSGRSCKINSTHKGHLQSQNPSASGVNSSKLPLRERSAASVTNKSKRGDVGSTSETEKVIPKKFLTENMIDKLSRSMDHLKKQNALLEMDKDKKSGPSWKTMDAWKEKRNWEDILASPYRGSSRFSHSPGMNRKSAERVRNLHVKLMSPEKKKKTAVDLKKEAEQKHARAMRIRSELENERIQKLQRTSEKLSRVNEWQAVRSMKLREGMYERHQRSESRHEAFLAQVVKRAGDESIKVNEVRFITSLNDENKKLILRQKLHDSELRRAEKLLVMKTKQKEDMAREEAVLERKKLIEAEKLQRLAETQRRKEEALVRREEERKASSAAREARAIEQLRRKEFRAKAQQEEAELLAQKLAERLSESEQRRKFYLEQIRERASMDFRDQSSPLLRRFLNKDAQGRSTPTCSGEEYEANNITDLGGSTFQTGDVALQHSLKRRIKKIRQRLMALKYEFLETPASVENAGVGYRAAVGTARSKIGRWLQELQRFRQARKEGAASIGLITAEMIKFLEGKEPELHASRQAGLLDFIASALPASHTSKPEAYQVTIYLLRLLKVVLSVPANRSYFIAQNLLPPIIPMLAATLENYIKIAASSNVYGSSTLLASKTSVGNLEAISEALDGFLWTVAIIIGHVSSDERQLQMQDGLQELVLAYQVIHRLRDLFALYDRPQMEGSPFPSSIHLSINMLAVLTSRSRKISSFGWESSIIESVPDNKIANIKLAERADSGCSPVTNRSVEKGPELAALNNDMVLSLPDVPEDRSLDEQGLVKRNEESVLDEKDSDGFKIVSTGTADSNKGDDSQSFLVDTATSSVPKKDEKSSVDDSAGQKNDNILALKPSVKFLLSAISETGLVCLPSLLTAVLLHANSRLSSELALHVLPSNFEEVATGVLMVLNNLALIDISFMQKMLARPDLKMEFFHVMSFLLSYCTSKWRLATDKVGLLLLESLLLLGYFSLFHPENQAVLRWGKSPTILHKVCDLPFVFFSDLELMPVLAGALVAACYGCEQNKGVVQQELSTDMLLSLLKSCRKSLPTVRSSSSPDNPSTGSYNENTQLGPESRKIQGEMQLKNNRHNLRSTRISSAKCGALGNGMRSSKMRTLKENKISRPYEEMSLKQNQSSPETSSTLMLHSRFSESLIDRAEQFFAAESTSLSDEV